MEKWRRAEIVGVGAYLPEKIYTNDDLAGMMETSDEWIRERTGIQQRHIAALDEGTSDLGVKAARQALARANMQADELDLILAATLSPDYYFPGIGVLIQHKLGAKTIPAMDLRGQCSGFAWSLATADAYIRAGLYKNILVVGSEIHSRIVEFSDRGRNVSVLFGDAAGCAILKAQAGDGQSSPLRYPHLSGLIDHQLGSDGSGAELLAVMRPGCASGQEEFITGPEAAEKMYLPVMDGRQVFKNAVSRMIEAVSELLARNHLRAQDIDLLIPHQANLRINEMVRQKLELPPEKVFNNIQKYGNTTSATLPLCMVEAEAEGRLKKGQLVLTVAFGSGFTWGANLLRW